MRAMSPRKPGRPLSFDRDGALHQAMLVFWRHGYESSSLAELTAAMGITAPSLYTAFGDKKRLFLEAVQRYAGDPAELTRMLEGAATAREAAESLLQHSARLYTGKSTPPGCLIATSVASCSAEGADLQAEMAAVRLDVESRLRRRIAAGMRDGELPVGTDAAGLAAHTVAVIQGMSTLARDGASRAKLMKLAETAMAAWPPPPAARRKVPGV